MIYTLPDDDALPPDGDLADGAGANKMGSRASVLAWRLPLRSVAHQ